MKTKDEKILMAEVSILYYEKKHTQQEIADILGTSQTMYARYERGANELPVRHLITLCRYYKVSPDYILGFSKHR